MSGSIVESDYPLNGWLDFSGMLQPGEVYTLEAGAECSSWNADPGVIDVQLQLIPEPANFTLLGLGSLTLVMVRRRK